MMRPTTNDYIERLDKGLSFSEFYDKVTKFAKLTNRKLMLGDFVATDEEGRPIILSERGEIPEHDRVKEQNKFDEAQSRIIFKGDWEVVNKPNGFIILKHSTGHILSYSTEMKKFHLIPDVVPINRIEDLPREIEFKEGLI